jgi:hypothetical protein
MSPLSRVCAAVSLALGAGGSAVAAEAHPRNAAFLELGGPGLLYSVNYERTVQARLALRGGFSRFALVEQGTDRSMGATLFPLTAAALVGKGGHHLECGIGATLGAFDGNLNVAVGEPRARVPFVAGVGQVGYRYQVPASGLLLRAAFTPLLTGTRFMPLGSPVLPWGGISAGWRF